MHQVIPIFGVRQPGLKSRFHRAVDHPFNRIDGDHGSAAGLPVENGGDPPWIDHNQGVFPVSPEIEPGPVFITTVVTFSSEEVDMVDTLLIPTSYAPRSHARPTSRTVVVKSSRLCTLTAIGGSHFKTTVRASGSFHFPTQYECQ